MPDFLTRKISAHQSLRSLVEAARLCGLPVKVITLMEVQPPAGWRGWPRLVAKKFGLLLVHLVLAWDVVRLGRGQFGLVREFLAVPTLLVWPVMWFGRRHVLFVVNHNFDSALTSRVQHVALRFLWSTGMRLLCFETTAALDELGFRHDGRQAFPLPHPLTPPLSVRSRSVGREPVVGIIGNLRSEKALGELMRVLTNARQTGEIRVRLLIGTSDLQVRRQYAALGWDEVDTTRDHDYHAALARCDVLVLNYSRRNHGYRPSGVISDALRAGVFVVAPNYPVIAAQLSQPTRVGLTFDALAELPATINQAIKLAAGISAEAYEQQLAARRPESLARRLREIFATFSDNPRKSPPNAT